MNKLENISHLYKGLLLRNRAFASFKVDELDTIYKDILNANIGNETTIFDPMSGYGGGMSYFAMKGYSTYNVELNPPAYYWQIIINPKNKNQIIDAIERIKTNRKLPKIQTKYSITDELFNPVAINHIERLFEYVKQNTHNEELAKALLLPFVARFANYQKNDTNFTHFKQGGLCSFVGWENDFFEYIDELENRLRNISYPNEIHTNIRCNILDFDSDIKFKCFVTSPPYPNYRDYSKIFKIENWVLNNIFNHNKTNFEKMIGSDVIKGKEYGEIHSKSAIKFLNDILDKSKKLSKKSRKDVEVYYYPYFALYFYNIQQAYYKLDKLLTNDVIGYIVVNNNITRDIQVPVGRSICDIFSDMNYNTSIIDESEIAHLGNIRRKAKRINSRHIRQIVKVWKK